MSSDNYSWILDYISYLWNEAVKINNAFYNDKRYGRLIDSLREECRRYKLWPLKKLLVLSGYLPMFLRIIFAQWKKRGRNGFCCNRVCYVDTHAGFGIDVIGFEFDDVVLGSPLISLLWPKHVKESVSQFRNLGDNVPGAQLLGPYFDSYFFNDIDPVKMAVLKSIVKYISSLNEIPSEILNEARIEYRQYDINAFVKYIANVISENNYCALVFIDPPGSVDAHITFDVLCQLASASRVVDAIIVFHDGMLSRIVGNNPNAVEHLLSPRAYNLLCNSVKCSKGVQEALVEAYKITLIDAGFKCIKKFAVKYVAGSKPLYHVYIATKNKESPWLNGFEVWYRLRRRIEDMSYEELKGYFLQVKGKQRTLLQYCNQKQQK